MLLPLPRNNNLGSVGDQCLLMHYYCIASDPLMASHKILGSTTPLGASLPILMMTPVLNSQVLTRSYSSPPHNTLRSSIFQQSLLPLHSRGLHAMLTFYRLVDIFLS